MKKRLRSIAEILKEENALAKERPHLPVIARKPGDPYYFKDDEDFLDVLDGQTGARSPFHLSPPQVEGRLGASSSDEGVTLDESALSPAADHRKELPF